MCLIESYQSKVSIDQAACSGLEFIEVVYFLKLIPDQLLSVLQAQVKLFSGREGGSKRKGDISAQINSDYRRTTFNWKRIVQ